MILASVLDGVWALATIKKKVKEVSEETKVEYKEDVTKAHIITALYLLLDKARGKAKTGIGEILKKLDEGVEEPSWDAVAKTTIGGDTGKTVRKATTPEEVKKTDLEVLQDILKKMNIEV